MNEEKTLDSQKLMNIRNKIEKMNKIHHLKFFEILFRPARGTPLRLSEGSPAMARAIAKLRG